MPCKLHGPTCTGHATRAAEERPVLEAAEVRKLLAVVEGSPVEHAVLLVMYDAALRSKELSMLRWESIDFDLRLATIPRAAKGRDRTGDVKEPRKAKIPLTQATCNALASLRQSRGVGPFPAARWGPREYQHWFRSLCTKAGIARAKAYSHVLRASRATHLYEAGADVKEIQRQLGHWSEASTWIYLHMTDARKQLAARRAEQSMNAVLKKGADDDEDT